MHDEDPTEAEYEPREHAEHEEAPERKEKQFASQAAQST
jgi:hypothetical protein